MFPPWPISEVQHERQDQPGAVRFIHFVVIVMIMVDPLRAEGLAGPGVESIRPLK